MVETNEPKYEAYKGCILSPGITMPAQGIHEYNVYVSVDALEREEPIHEAGSLEEARAWIDRRVGGKEPSAPEHQGYANPGQAQEYEEVRVWLITDKGRGYLHHLYERGVTYTPIWREFTIEQETASWIVLDILDKRGSLTDEQIHSEEVTRWGRGSAMILSDVTGTLEFLLNYEYVTYNVESRLRPPLPGRVLRVIRKRF